MENKTYTSHETVTFWQRTRPFAIGFFFVSLLFLSLFSVCVCVCVCMHVHGDFFLLFCSLLHSFHVLQAITTPNANMYVHKTKRKIKRKRGRIACNQQTPTTSAIVAVPTSHKCFSIFHIPSWLCIFIIITVIGWKWRRVCESFHFSWHSHQSILCNNAIIFIIFTV